MSLDLLHYSQLLHTKSRGLDDPEVKAFVETAKKNKDAVMLRRIRGMNEVFELKKKLAKKRA